MTVINCNGTRYLEIKEKRYLIESAKTVYLDFNKLTLSVVCLSAKGFNATVTYEILFRSIDKMKKCAQSIVTRTSAALMLKMHRILPSIHKKRKIAEISFEFPALEDVEKFKLVALPRVLGEEFRMNSRGTTVQLSLQDDPLQDPLIDRVNGLLSNLNQWIAGNVVQQSLSKQAESKISIEECKSELLAHGKAPVPFTVRCLINATSHLRPISQDKGWVSSKDAEWLILGRTRAELVNLKSSLVRRRGSREGESLTSQINEEYSELLSEIDRVLSLNREPTFRENSEITRLLEKVSLPQEGEPSYGP